MSRTPRRAMLITPTRTYLDDPAETVSPTPADAFAGGLPALLDRVSGTFDGEGVLLVDGRAAVALGLPIYPADLPPEPTAPPAPAADDGGPDQPGPADDPADSEQGDDDHSDDDTETEAASESDDGADPAGPEVHAVIAAARAAGWQCSHLRAWTTYHTADDDPRPAVHVGILPLLAAATRTDRTLYPLLTGQWADTLAAHRLWHDLTGAAYRATPGVSGMAILRELADAGPGLDKNGKRKRPTWQPKTPAVIVGGYRRGVPHEDAGELPYTLSQWGRTEPGVRIRVGYDARMMYLAAAGVVLLSPRGLRRTGKITYRADLAGWWLVRIAPWQLGDQFPDPAGYVAGHQPGQPAPAEPRWVTGPTLALLDDLVAAEVHGGYEVLDSWTCGTSTARTGPYKGQERGSARTVLKPWAEKLRDAMHADEMTGVEWFAREGHEYDDTGRCDLIATWAGLKESYSRTIGMLNSATSLVRRPDWHYAIIAQARSNLFRAMWKAGTKTADNPSPRYPLGIDVDLVWYAADTTDRDELKSNPPHGFRMFTGAAGTPKLGGFTVKKVEMKKGARRGH